MRNPWAQTGNYRTGYRQDTSIFATHRELVSLLLFLGFLLLLPQFLSRTQVFILDLILVYSVAVLGLNITTGYAGLINIGQAAFMGVGAYTAALLAPLGLPFWLLIPLGGLVAAFFGFLVGIPSLRVKHLYLALATLAFQIIFEWTVGHSPLLKQGGAMDMPRASFLGYEAGFRNHFHFWYYVSLATLVVLALFWRNLLRTRYGRALIAVRDNDRAADAMGMDPGRTKLFAFALGAFYAGVAGVLYAYLSRAVVIEDSRVRPLGEATWPWPSWGGSAPWWGASWAPPSWTFWTSTWRRSPTWSRAWASAWPGWTWPAPSGPSPLAW
jgi:branched-chain amino acid transport system permease protein